MKDKANNKLLSKLLFTIECMYWIITEKTTINIDVFAIIIHLSNALKYTYNKEIFTFNTIFFFFHFSFPNKKRLYQNGFASKESD